MEHKNLQLREMQIFPTDKTLKEILGDSYNAYSEFQSSLLALELEQEWQWYTPYKAWFAKGQYKYTTARGTQKEKTIYWMYFFKGYFNVAIWFKEKNRMELLKVDTSESTKKLIRETNTMGKLPTFPIQFDVHNTQLLPDIFTLIKTKKILES